MTPWSSESIPVDRDTTDSQKIDPRNRSARALTTVSGQGAKGNAFAAIDAYVTERAGIALTRRANKYCYRMLRGRILDSSRGYRLFRWLIKADRSMRIIVSEYVKPTPGMRVLDIGCGNADLAVFVPDCEYLGVDSNADYIAFARQRNIDVIEADVAQLLDLGYEFFDVAIGIGLLHHLNDDQVANVLNACRAVLRPQGRILFVEPTFHPEQGTISRRLMLSDRGNFVREQDQYLQLARQAFPHANVTVRHDLNPFPYAHAIVQATMEPVAVTTNIEPTTSAAPAAL